MADVIVVMGVSGVGKTTVGQALAARIDAQFAEGDSYHPKANVDKMRSGRPLTDEDRWPWLDRLRAAIEGWLRGDRPVVLACSALKASYRRRLTSGSDGASGAGRNVATGRVRFIYLEVNRDLIEQRLAARRGHYMPASLLESQLATLEPPKDAITVDASRPLDAITADLMACMTSGREPVCE